MTTHKGFVDGRRAILMLQGSDAKAVLQGVVTNDVEQVAPGQAVYAALLTPQGKYLSDFFLLDGGDGAVLIDAPASQATALATRLKMYCLRRDAKIVPREEMHVGCVWPDAPEGLDDAITCVRDPRHVSLGWRLYCENEGLLASAMGSTVDRAEYDAVRVRALVPESGVELVPEDTYILEAGFEHLNGVDFKKGCYVGQEVTARMKHKTELRKGLVEVTVNGEAAPGTAITANGKPAGTLFTTSGGRGLAHLRLDRAGPGMQAGEASVDYTG